jgi:hypothetical protein
MSKRVVVIERFGVDTALAMPGIGGDRLRVTIPASLTVEQARAQLRELADSLHLTYGGERRAARPGLRKVR